MREQVIGVLSIGSEKVDFFSDEMIGLLTLFAAQASVALENARLYQSTVELQSYREAIVESIQQGIVVTDADGNVETINGYLKELWRLQASDLLLTADSPPVLRVDGVLAPMDGVLPLSRDDTEVDADDGAQDPVAEFDHAVEGRGRDDRRRRTAWPCVAAEP